MLLRCGAAVEKRNSRGQTALMLAAGCGNASVLGLLLNRGARVDEVDQDGRSALSYAAYNSQTGSAEALLAVSASPNLRDHKGMTPCLVACGIGHELTLLALLENVGAHLISMLIVIQGGDPTLKNNKGEDGAALAADNPKLLEIIKSPDSAPSVRLLLDHPACSRAIK